MADPWSRFEVEATVADYFDMLEWEIKGEPYNKSEHRRNLANLLDARSHGAIERKHQNISAVLIELNFVYNPGYKPLRNYQKLLFEIVNERLRASRHLSDLLATQAEQSVTVPSVDDILSAMVDPPADRPRESTYGSARERPPTSTNVDYVKLEARNRRLGLAGEEFVVRFETARLVSLGHEPLASQIEHVSMTRGDGLGYDVLSFDTSGQERLIEVKTTAYGPLIPFFVTRNEVEVSRRSPDRYRLYRTYNFRQSPKIYEKRGSIDDSFDLDPMQFVATLV